MEHKLRSTHEGEGHSGEISAGIRTKKTTAKQQQRITHSRPAGEEKTMSTFPVHIHTP